MICLLALMPQECACFKSAQLPIKLVFKTSAHPIDWQGSSPLAGSGTEITADAAAQAATAAAASSALQEGGTGSGLAGSAAGSEATSSSQLEQQRCVVIYKKGDDLRQDQFILQVT